MKSENAQPTMSWRWIVLCAIAAIAFAAGGAWVLRAHLETHAKESDQFLKTIAEYKAQELAVWVQDQMDDALALQKSAAFMEPLSQYLAGDGTAPSKTLEDLVRYVAVSHDVDDVILLDRDGKVRFSLSGTEEVHSEGVAAIQEALRNLRPIMTDVHLDTRTKQAHLGVAVPVVCSGTFPGEAAGGVLLVTRASRFIDPVTQVWPVPSASGEVLLVRREGDAVIFLSALRYAPDAAFRLRLPLNRQDSPAAMAAQGHTGVVYGIDYRGVPVKAAITPVQGTSWFLVVKMDRREIEAAGRKIFLSTVGHIIGFIILLFVLVFWAKQRAHKAHFKRLYQAEAELRRSLARQAAVVQAMSEAVIATDSRGRVEVWNAEAEKLTEWSAQEVHGKPLANVVTVCGERKNLLEEGLWRLARQGGELEGDETIFVQTRSGRKVPVALKISKLEGASNDSKALIFCVRDQSRERLSRRIMEIRLELMERSETQGLDEVLPPTLQAVADLLESGEGFYVALNGDGSRVSCVHWSENVPKSFCGGRVDEGHRELHQAGLWADAVRTGKPVIVNAYGSSRLERGLPEGHGRLRRLLVVPVVRDGVPRALLALANKTSDYTESDAETLEILAGIIHQVVEHRQAEEGLRQSEARYRSLFRDHKAVKLLIDPTDGRIVDANQAAVALYGWSHEQLTQMFIQQINTLPPEVVKERMAEVEGGRRGYFEFQHRCADGSVRDVEVYSSRVDVGGKAYLHSVIHDVTGKKRMEAERARWLTAIEQAGEVVLITDPEGFIQYVNPAFETVTGYTRDEAVGQKPGILKSGLQDEAFYRELWTTLKAGKKWSGRMVNKKKDGTLYTEEATITPVKDAEGRIVNFVAVMRDITEKLRLEEQFHQAQKLESVGRLAGGVAHDYNNSLTIILGFADMALRRVPSESVVARYLHEIIRAGERSAAITRQLLAFARKQIINPVLIDVNTAVAGTLKMLQRLIGEDIHLVWQPGANLWKVKLDPVQLDQILVNLCVNAKDAIGGVGTITLETANVSFDEAYCAAHAEFVPGDYVMLAVTDTGCGMDKDTLGKIFEPFFTTKEMGKGTGLGLSTVYGIVRQNQGFVNVYSEVGVGTTFKIYLPRAHEAEVTAVEERSVPEIPRARGETILVVEDDRVLLEMTETMLKDLGYEVLVAAGPVQALDAAREHPGFIDLLITDVVMPDMNGKNLAAEIRDRRPGIKVLFTSGYTANAIAHHGVLDPGVFFLPKPFGYQDLALRVRQVLDSSEG
ncbi:PAS domain S-box protein [Desulfosoma caldarium]|uniref:histidine kinase n=1 Tax=Desulfosoma caldarium TaxID=610254 RepID=A0A3N1VG20_9BACT|nr:PAS domain S-box protein [Desulfosoma caldarium]ROR01786.1 PAS domain S-box-containing protein [Desulfosoma caldarium]